MAERIVVADIVEPFDGPVMETAGGVVSGIVLLTVTETDAEVVWLPAASRATAVSVWLPFVTDVVFQETENGAEVFSAPKFVPSSLNWTPTTPTLSEAVAKTVIELPETVLPDAGAVIDTVGGVVSAGGGGDGFESLKAGVIFHPGLEVKPFVS